MNNPNVARLATLAILAAARRNANITSAGLRDEIDRGDIAGWLHLAAVKGLQLLAVDRRHGVRRRRTRRARPLRRIG